MKNTEKVLTTQGQEYSVCNQHLLKQIFRELESLHGDLIDFQSDLSDMLLTVKISNAQLYRLQFLDKTTQELGELARIGNYIFGKEVDQRSTITGSEVESFVCLSDLRNRIVDGSRPEECQTLSTNCEVGDVNFFEN
ncbi:hypothetical protein [Aliiruegeria haliotis]|uniref:hypothetical protein n=1 Tax=Aliiruegeria haliotis TaxID=1280846 RepID=UPI000D082854|nr:hypothetical protein [Aliiruegeria haliotis]